MVHVLLSCSEHFKQGEDYTESMNRNRQTNEANKQTEQQWE